VGMDCGARRRTRDLRDLVLVALRDQGIAARRLRWMGQHAGHLFRCETADGERLVIRCACRASARTPRAELGIHDRP
jgi:hypothetical protein